MKGKLGILGSVIRALGLSRAVTLIAIYVFVIGCGGGGAGSNSGGRYAQTQLSSTLDLGTSSRAPSLDDLSVRTSAGAGDVTNAGIAPTVIFKEGPQFAEILDSEGRTVLMAFASPTEPNFSAHSTAKAIAYLSLSGAWMKETARLKLLNEAETMPGFSSLESAIQSQIDTLGYLDLDAPAIQSPIGTMVSAAYGPNRGVIADPTTASGLSLDTTVDSKLTIENVYLRRVSLFSRRVSYVDAAGETQEENNPFTRTDMPNIARYGGITGTLDGYFKGEVAYSPVRTTPALDIPRFPATARSTVYQVFAIGAAFSSHPNLNVPADIVGEQQYLEVKTLFLDGFLVLVANAGLPLKGEEIDEFLGFAAGNAVITDIIGNLKTNIPDLGTKLGEGDYPGALKLVMTSAYTSNTALPLVSQVAIDFIWRNSSIGGDATDRLQTGMKGVLDKMGKIDVGFTFADSFLLFRDIASSKRIEQFLITVTPGKVTLTAANQTVNPLGSTTIDAVVQDEDPNGTYEYRWSVAPNANYWLEDRTLAGTDDAPNGILITSESRVTLRSIVNANGVATVNCKVFRLDGGRREVGEKSLPITFEANTSLVNTYSEYKVRVIVQQVNGQYKGRGGIYMDFPHIDGAFEHAVRFTKLTFGGGFQTLTIRRPFTSNYFATSVHPDLLEGVPEGSFRVWFNEWTGNSHSTSAAALAEITQMGVTRLNQTSGLTVTVTTRVD